MKKQRHREKMHGFTDPSDIDSFAKKVAAYKKAVKVYKQGEGLWGIAKQLNITHMQAVWAYCSALVKIEKHLRAKGYDEYWENIGILNGSGEAWLSNY